MMHKIVAVFDHKAEAFLKPVFVQSNGAAVRSFGDGVNNPETEFYKHPEDYTIFALGEWDDSNGVFYQSETATTPLAKAVSLKTT